MSQFKVGDWVKYDSGDGWGIIGIGNKLALLLDKHGNEVSASIDRLSMSPRTVTVTIPAELAHEAMSAYPPKDGEWGSHGNRVAQAVADSLRQQEKGPTP